jgi:recombinational DNA repair protein RecR
VRLWMIYMYKQDIKCLEHCAAVNCDYHVQGEEIQVAAQITSSAMESTTILNSLSEHRIT